jgi:ERCC4-type nuclease
MSRDHPTPRVPIVVDDRERRCGLHDAIAAFGREVTVARLDVGDVVVGRRIVIERKTVADFAASVAERRIFDQAYALRGACDRPILVIEGAETAEIARLAPEMLRGVIASLFVGYGIPVLRTRSPQDTAGWVNLFAEREDRRLARRAEFVRRDDARRTAIDVLSAIPGVGPRRARCLLKAVGPPAVVLASDESALREVVGIGPETASKIRAVARGLAVD